MSTHLDGLTKALRNLPYADMVKVAQALSEELKGIHSAHHLADALVNLRPKLLADMQDLDNDEAVFRERFRRKVVMVIQPIKGSGWEVDIPAQRGALARATTLREALNASLDQTLVVVALEK